MLSQENQAQQNPKIPQELFNCKICKRVFYKPVTLNCGHTFCRSCIKNIHLLKENPLEKKNKIPVCPCCDNIIWRPISELHENRTLQSLIQKYNYSRQSEKVENVMEQEIHINPNIEGTFTNKILLNCKKPQTFPMPFCYTEITFSTAFIEDITEQSKQLVLMWDDPIFQYALLGSLQKIQPLNQSHSSKVILNNHVNPDNLQEQQYKATFLGHFYVQLLDVGSISIDLSHKYIILGENKKKIEAELNICDCRIVHSKNYQMLNFSYFDTFFTFYDSLNNHHYMRQIAKLINQGPFISRNNPQTMIYCVLRVLKLPQKLRQQIVNMWDDLQRMQAIDNWIIEKQSLPKQQIMNIKVPGKYNNGVVFFVIFILFALNFFQQ